MVDHVVFMKYCSSKENVGIKDVVTSPDPQGPCDSILKPRELLNASPTSVSDMTEATTNSLLIELADERTKVNDLEGQLQEYEKIYGESTCPNAERVDESIKNSVEQVVKKDLFPRKKFLQPIELHQMDKKTNTIASFIMDKLHIETKRRQSFWNGYKSIVHESLITTRTSRIGQLRRMYMKECKQIYG